MVGFRGNPTTLAQRIQTLFILKFVRHLFLLATVLTQCTFMHAQDSLKNNNLKANKANFQAKIDTKQATKDGVYLNGYVVNIPYKKLEELNGKTVRIKGKVTIVEGTKHYQDGEFRQGRQEDTKHILKPKIKVIDD